jgi:hypothetical protein
MTHRDKDQEAFPELESELRALTPADPGEDFFAAQRDAVLLQLELTDLPVNDPGDLFFHRQAKAIGRQLQGETRVDTRGGFWAIWARPLAAAAALFFLVLGVARITHRQDGKMTAGWGLALQQMAEEEGPSLEDIEEMSEEQLQRLAHNLEGAILVEFGGQMLEEPMDLDDLNEPELRILIERLEDKRQT